MVAFAKKEFPVFLEYNNMLSGTYGGKISFVLLLIFRTGFPPIVPGGTKFVSKFVTKTVFHKILDKISG